MTSSAENLTDSSDATVQELPKVSPNPNLNPLQVIMQQVGKIGTKQEELAKAMQQNDELLVDGVANLEMRVNLVFAILHDLANKQVKFEGREQHKRDNDGAIDVRWYYERYMTALKKEEEEAAAVKEAASKEPDFPADAVIFGGTT